MIRVVVEIGKRRCGSLFLHDDNSVELHTRDQACFLEALALAVSALGGRECARLCPETRKVPSTDGEKGEGGVSCRPGAR